MRQDTSLELIPDQWHDLFKRFADGEDVGPGLIDSSVVDPMNRGSFWLGERFKRFTEEQQGPMVKAVSSHLSASSDSPVLPELLSLAGKMGVSGFRDTIRAIFESTEDVFLKKRALSSLINIEKAATARGETRSPVVYQFWDELINRSNSELATWGFHGLRKLDLVRAVGSLDRLFGIGEDQNSIARTLRGMRRNAINQHLDIAPALRDFLAKHPDLGEDRVAMMREAFGEALMSVV